MIEGTAHDIHRFAEHSKERACREACNIFRVKGLMEECEGND
jgi:hypothetical protein